MEGKARQVKWKVTWCTSRSGALDGMLEAKMMLHPVRIERRRAIEAPVLSAPPPTKAATLADLSHRVGRAAYKLPIRAVLHPIHTYNWSINCRIWKWNVESLDSSENCVISNPGATSSGAADASISPDALSSPQLLLLLCGTVLSSAIF